MSSRSADSNIPSRLTVLQGRSATLVPSRGTVAGRGLDDCSEGDFRQLSPGARSVQAANLGAAVYNCGEIVHKTVWPRRRGRETMALTNIGHDDAVVDGFDRYEAFGPGRA